MPLLEMRDVSIEFETAAGTVEAVRNFNLTLMPGRKLAIVGESGSGKSTVAATINGLLAENGRVSRGEIRFAGQNIVGMRDDGLRKLRGAQIARDHAGYGKSPGAIRDALLLDIDHMIEAVQFDISGE